MSEPLTDEEWAVLQGSSALEETEGAIGNWEASDEWCEIAMAEVESVRRLVPRLMEAYIELERLASDLMSAWEAEKVEHAKARIQLATPADLSQLKLQHRLKRL